MYVDGVCCYWPSSMVCLCVGWSVTSEPCKDACTNWDAVWVENFGGPREPRIRWGSRSPGERAILRGKGVSHCKVLGTLCDCLCKNSWTNRDAVWVEDWGWPREPCIRWGSRCPMGRGNFWKKEEPSVSIGTLCREMCKNGWTDWFAFWIVDSVGWRKHKFNCRYSPDGANVPSVPLNHPMWGGNAACCQITLTTSY